MDLDSTPDGSEKHEVDEFEVDQIYYNTEDNTNSFGSTAGTSGTGVGSAGDGRDSVKANDCVVCYSRPKNTICLPCRHLCICRECSDIIKHMSADSNMRNRCPMCRAMASQFIHINDGESEQNTE